MSSRGQQTYILKLPCSECVLVLRAVLRAGSRMVYISSSRPAITQFTHTYAPSAIKCPDLSSPIRLLFCSGMG